MLKSYSRGQIKALFGALLLMMAFGMINASVGYFVAPVTQALHFQRAAFTMYYTIMNLVGIAVMPFMGKLISRYAPGRLILVGGLWGGVCLAGFSICRQLWMFYAFGVLFGFVQSGTTMLIAVSIINSWFGEKSGTPTGFAMAGTGVSGVLLGLLFPGFLAGHSWRAGYVVLAVLWVVALLFAALLAGKKVAAAADGKAQKNENYLRAVHSAKLYIFMFAVLVLTVPGCFLQHMPAFFVEQGTTAARAGAIMSIFSFCVIVFKILQGFLYDRFGAAKTTALAAVVYAGGYWIALQSGLPALYTAAVFLAFGMASLTVLPPLLTRAVFGTDGYAEIYSVTSMAYGCGNAIGAPIWGLVHDRTGAYTLGLQVTPFILAADLLLLLAILARSKKQAASSAAETLK